MQSDAIDATNELDATVWTTNIRMPRNMYQAQQAFSQEEVTAGMILSTRAGGQSTCLKRTSGLVAF